MRRKHLQAREAHGAVRREAEGDVDQWRRRRRRWRAVKPSRREAAAEAAGLANFLDGLGYLRLFFFSAKVIFSSM
jgi:hypothetical protein